jgi:hypothetical protein
MLGQVQRGLEALYRIETEVDVTDFVIDAAARAKLCLARSPREQLLVAETNGELEVGLFVDERALANLQRNDPREHLGEHNLQDFLLCVEGVSHFVYLVWRAQLSRPVSALELELQAEVDKYVTCLLTMGTQAGRVSRLRETLFEQFSLEPGLSDGERERYLCANSNARSYAATLDARFVRLGSWADMLSELRRFYRLGVSEKLEHIQRVA